MKVIVYVEGPSDKNALQTLLEPILVEGRNSGVGISFSPQGGKAPILSDVPRKAAEYLLQNPGDWIFALPDLYPMASYDVGPHPHGSFDEMSALLHGRFKARADKIGLSEDARARFRVHCLKHDLEALLLAAPDELRERLKTEDKLRDRWVRPVENQNDKTPPKRIVERLFEQYLKRKYVDTSDAVWILKHAKLADIEAACGQRFAPFVRDLRASVASASPTRSP